MYLYILTLKNVHFINAHNIYSRCLGKPFNMSWRWYPPFLVWSVQGFVDGTHYTKGRYAVRKNIVRRQHFFTLKSCTFHQEKKPWHIKSMNSMFCSLAHISEVSAFIRLNMDWGGRKWRIKSSKHRKSSVWKYDCASSCHKL